MKSFRQWRFVRKTLIWNKVWKWARYYLKQSGVFSTGFDREIFQARIRKEAHTIEKGLSLPIVRPAFGQKKIEKLQRDILVSEKTGELEADLEIARDVLRSYADWHVVNDSVPTFVTRPKDELFKSPTMSRRGGTVPFNRKISDEERENFDAVMLTRRSIRNYSIELVPLDVLQDAIRVAWSSPSVCNRQPWAVAIVQSPAMVRKMLDLQSGNRGFDQTIGNLLVVFADTKAFVEDYELFEPFVDSGIFSGALVNALHSRNIGSCCLNLCVSHKIAARITREMNLPDHYFPIMMISIGYPAEHCDVAMSTRGPNVTFQR